MLEAEISDLFNTLFCPYIDFSDESNIDIDITSINFPL